ncbi:hypothetical protein [Chryseobacterium sp. 3008163]|uniref:hypothetical protein n=1 Tax=Chryseobacterium sp. 3008163 TaxID=2478663 RepID=UPI000F0C5C81|nr:hypothetical protein [Chryseobacterium sp. 3008163]AYN00779.1 hypothetical protein EAG08_11055 [Chryseobacterium sp. 3008163]
MKNLLIVLVILFLGCSKKETENIIVYQITVSYTGHENSPSQKIILTDRKPNENVFPEVNYQVEKKDLMKIEEISYSKLKEFNEGLLLLVKITKDNKIQKYYFNKNDGVEILDKIKKITSHNNNDRLNADLSDLQLKTKNTNKQNWYNDVRVIRR